MLSHPPNRGAQEFSAPFLGLRVPHEIFKHLPTAVCRLLAPGLKRQCAISHTWRDARHKDSALPTAASYVPESQASKYVSSVGWNGSIITATAQGESKISGSTITLTSTLTAATNQVNWQCAGTIGSKYRPSSCK
jgi:hypothetical protein